MNKEKRLKRAKRKARQNRLEKIPKRKMRAKILAESKIQKETGLSPNALTRRQ